MLDTLGVFLYTELMIKLKIKYNESNPVNHLDNVYGDLHKLDEKIQEVSKLVDNHKD